MGAVDSHIDSLHINHLCPVVREIQLCDAVSVPHDSQFSADDPL